MKCEQKEERNRVKKWWRNVEKAIYEEAEASCILIVFSTIFRNTLQFQEPPKSVRTQIIIIISCSSDSSSSIKWESGTQSDADI